MASKNSNIENPWFHHDENASSDIKIIKMSRHFRRLAKDLSREDLESLVYLAAYGIFWRLVESMHDNDITPGEEEEDFADELRINPEIVQAILNNFDLFQIKDGKYYSARINRNLEKQAQRSSKNKDAANVRWLLHSFNKAYQEFFNEVPILEPEEIESLKKYNHKIENFKEKLRDIIYTLTFVKFDNDINFKPCANWLLKGNNLARLLNGEFGKLRHKPTPAEEKAEAAKKEKQLQEEYQEQEELKQKELDYQAQIDSIYNKSDAIRFIIKNSKTIEFLDPNLKALASKFDISKSELVKAKKEIRNA